ncbi:MAG: glycosyltransferase family 1 protein [Armatimonadetes bacterium]|nr:glycosyltransferase family 1 protein [Armatimonadota bacterium]
MGQQLEVYMCPGLVRGAREAGCDAHAVDCFANPQDVAALLDSTPDDVCLVDRGHGLSADVVRRIPARTVLYYPDILPTLHHASAHGRLRYEEFRSVAPAYDDVILHDYHALEFLLGEGYRNLRGVVILPFDPRRHRAYGLPRDLDVVFIGSPSPHRTAWVDTLRAAGIDVAWPNAWGDLFVTWLNRARIVLNLHFAETPNTELRIVEALATRSFVVSEPISEPAAFQAGEHFATATLETAADVIRHSLAHPEERERIAAQGHAYVLGRHSSRHCVEEILSLLPEPA